MNHLLFSFHTCPMEEPGAGLSGGMNVFLRGLLPGLAARGCRTDVLTRAEGTEVTVTCPFPGVRIFHLPCGWRDPPSRETAYDALPRFAREARKLLAASPPHDAVSAHYWMSGIASLEAGLRPQAITYHTVEARKAASNPDPTGLSAIRREAEERLSREAYRVVCFSEDDLARTREIFPAVAGKGEVIPPGVDDAFRNPPPREEARRRLRIPDGAFLFLLAARRDPGKNVVSATEALRALRAAEGDRLRLLVAGQELPASLLSAGIDSSGPVAHAEMPFLYSAADAILCPSSYESFGLVPLEGMAAGRPVVAPAGGFWGETIRAGGGGIVYAPESETGLVEAMRAVYREDSLRARLSEEAKRIAARFTWERCTESWAQLLSGIATPGSPR